MIPRELFRLKIQLDEISHSELTKTFFLICKPAENSLIPDHEGITILERVELPIFREITFKCLKSYSTLILF